LPRFPYRRTTTTASSTSSSRMHVVKMSSDLERANRMLTFPTHREMITLMTYIGGGRQCNHVFAPSPFYPRERQSMRMLAKRTTNFVFGYRFVWLLTVELFVGAKHEKSHITLDYRIRSAWISRLLYF